MHPREFQKEVLSVLLYHKEFDTFEIEKDLKIDLNEVRSGLTNAYKDLDAFDAQIKKMIERHVRVIEKSIASLTSRTKGTHLRADDILPILLLKRSRHIVNLSTNLEEMKATLFMPLDTFFAMLSEFTGDPNFSLKSGTSDRTTLVKNGVTLDPENLSSGEKQLLVLLTETLLQQSENSIFIADEPELSLHIAWQRKLLGSIRILNPNAQVIVATHSPEIAGKWKNKIILMEKIIEER